MRFLALCPWLVALSTLGAVIGVVVGQLAVTMTCGFMLLVVVNAGLIVADLTLARLDSEEAVAPPERTARFPNGEGCPPGTCPVCGQHDPDRLERCWGHLDAHPSCAEWVRELPQLTREQWREQIHHFPSRSAEALPTMAGIRPSEMREILQEMGNPTPHPTEQEIDRYISRKAHQQRRMAEQAACPHRDIRALNDQTDVCGDCFAIQRPIPESLIQKPTPPPDPGPASPRAK
jgi:hypothetical protein